MCCVRRPASTWAAVTGVCARDFSISRLFDFVPFRFCAFSNSRVVASIHHAWWPQSACDLRSGKFPSFRARPTWAAALCARVRVVRSRSFRARTSNWAAAYGRARSSFCARYFPQFSHASNISRAPESRRGGGVHARTRACAFRALDCVFRALDFVFRALNFVFALSISFFARSIGQARFRARASIWAAAWAWRERQAAGR